MVTLGRKADGFSLRRALEDQGVTTEDAMRKHLSFVNTTLQINPALDITRYRVSTNDPNRGEPDNG